MDHKQVEFQKKLANIRKDHSEKELEKEFTEWSDHYHEELTYMYNNFFNIDSVISYENFVHTSYQCSDLCNRRMFKYTRLLI